MNSEHAHTVLHDAGAIVTFPRNHVIYELGERIDHLYVVQSGKVKTHRKGLDGREYVLALHGPGDMFGDVAVFDPGPSESTATTVTDVTVSQVERLDLRLWIAERPQFRETLLRVLAFRVRQAEARWADHISMDMPSRLAKVLLQLAYRFGSREGSALRVTHDLTQEEIGHLAGTTREGANKTLSDFAARGWLRIEHRSVVILKPERLAARAS